MNLTERDHTFRPASAIWITGRNASDELVRGSTIWYAFKADDDLATGDAARAMKWIDAMANVRPVDAVTQYALEMSRQHGASLRSAIADGA